MTRLVNAILNSLFAAFGDPALADSVSAAKVRYAAHLNARMVRANRAADWRG